MDGAGQEEVVQEPVLAATLPSAVPRPPSLSSANRYLLRWQRYAATWLVRIARWIDPSSG